MLGGHTGGFNSGIGQLHSGIGFLQFIRRVKRVRFYFNRTPVRLGGLRGGIGNVSDLTFKTFFGKASTFYGDRCFRGNDVISLAPFNGSDVSSGCFIDPS